MSRVEWVDSIMPNSQKAILGNCSLHAEQLHPQRPYCWSVYLPEIQGTAATPEEAKRAAEDALADLLREAGEKLKELREGREEQE